MTIEQFKNNWQPPVDSYERACFNLDLKELVQQTRAEAIDEYSSKLWRIIERATINCKLDLTIDDLHILEMLIKGLAEELKEKNNGRD